MSTSTDIEQALAVDSTVSSILEDIATVNVTTPNTAGMLCLDDSTVELPPLPDIPDRDDIKAIQTKLYTADDLRILKDTHMSNIDKTGALVKSMQTIYEAQHEFLHEIFISIFKEGNQKGETWAAAWERIIPNVMSDSLNAAKDIITSETFVEQVAKAEDVNRQRVLEELDIVELKLKQFEASDQMLDLLWMKSYLEGERLKLEYQLLMFEASPEMLKYKIFDLKSKSLKAESEINEAKARTMLTMKQYDGFGLDGKIKLLGIIFDAWSKAFMSNGIEAIPAALTDHVLSSLFMDASAITNGFNGGRFVNDLQLTSWVHAPEGGSISVAWDSGIINGIAEINISPDWTDISGYPQTVALNGSHSFTIDAPEDKTYAHSILITLTVTYYDEATALANGYNSGLNIDERSCCSITCGMPYVKTSTLVLATEVKDDTGDEDDDLDDIDTEVGFIASDNEDVVG